MRAVAPIRRDHEQIGPFLATFDPHSDNPYLNYAVPDAGAEPSDGDSPRSSIPTFNSVVGLVSSTSRLVRRRSKPRLLAAGFSVEGRLAVMVTNVGQLAADAEPQGIELRIPTTDDELYDMAVVQAQAYDEPEVPGRDIVAHRRAALAEGAMAVVAIDQNTRTVVAAGSCSPVNGGLTEVAAIGVSGAYRRRGIGGALAIRLGREALSAGADVPWLMAAHDSARRMYERAGYRVVGEILHISR